MGTSVNQSSPRTTSWRSVITGYESDQVTVDRVVKEIWHAAESEGSTVGAQIRSPAVFACYNLTQSNIPRDQIHDALSDVSSKYGNSMVVEFAKRATILASQGAQAARQWPSIFFRELTNYLVSRDASGYVGPASRSKTVGDLINLKHSIGREVQRVIGEVPISARNVNGWVRAANTALSALRKDR